jgi:multiple sugar transport system ATP-binding protein
MSLELRQVTKRFGSAEALSGVNLRIEENEFLCVLGPSGSGKTTLLRILAGLEAPSSGEFHREGRLSDAAANTAFVFQDLGLYPHKSVIGNVMVPLQARGVGHRDAQRRAEQALDQFAMAGLAQRLPHELSGGEAQRVALARALVRDPILILMDEPLAALDQHLRHEVLDYIVALKGGRDRTFVYVTHDQREAEMLADRIAVMFSGRIAQAESPSGLWTKPNSPKVASFFGAPPINLFKMQGGDDGRPTGLALTTSVADAEISTAAGETVYGVRPWNCALRPPGFVGGTEALRFPAIIVTKARVPPMVDYSISVGDAHWWVRGDDGHAVGDAVTLEVDLDQCLRWPITGGS